MAQSVELDEPKVGEQTTQDRLGLLALTPVRSRGVGGIRMDRTAGLEVAVVSDLRRLSPAELRHPGGLLGVRSLTGVAMPLRNTA